MAPTNLDDILEMQHLEETSNEDDYESEQEVDNDEEEEAVKAKNDTTSPIITSPPIVRLG